MEMIPDIVLVAGYENVLYPTMQPIRIALWAAKSGSDWLHSGI